MAGCDPDPPPPPELPSPPLLVPPPAGRSRLITRRDEPAPVYTGVRECDVVTAAKRGLREYLEQAHLDFYGQRVRFQRVTEQWGESDETMVLPAACIQARDEATYDTGSMQPRVISDPVGINSDGTNQYLVRYCEVVVPLVIEIHTSSPEERSQVSMLLEDALNPVDWMYGFKIDLPHYFGQRCVFDPVKTQQLDSEDSARRRWRPGSVLLTAQLSLVRVRSLPTFTPLVSVGVT